MTLEGEEKENIELAKEHLNIADELILKESKKHDPEDKISKEYGEAAFAIEKAESEVEDIEEA